MKKMLNPEIPRLEGSVIWDASHMPEGPLPRTEQTNLIRFRDHWYVGFRESKMHFAHQAGRSRIIRSSDGESWESVALFDWDCACVRDPFLSITAEGLLMVNAALTFVSREPREVRTDDGTYVPPEAAGEAANLVNARYYQLDSHRVPKSQEESQVARQSVTWLSRDGVTWSSATACPTGVNVWRWTATWHNGMGYCAAREGTLFRTRDGKSWRPLAEGIFPEGMSNEASLVFETSGRACCLLRHHPNHLPIGLADGPYYQSWSWRQAWIDWDGDGDARAADQVLRAPFGGPRTIRLKDGRIIVAARVLGPGSDDGRITLFWVDPEGGVLTRFADCNGTTYGDVAEHDGKLWVTFSRAKTASQVLLATMDIPAKI